RPFGERSGPGPGCVDHGSGGAAPDRRRVGGPPTAPARDAVVRQHSRGRRAHDRRPAPHRSCPALVADRARGRGRRRLGVLHAGIRSARAPDGERDSPAAGERPHGSHTKRDMGAGTGGLRNPGRGGWSGVGVRHRRGDICRQRPIACDAALSADARQRADELLRGAGRRLARRVEPNLVSDQSLLARAVELRNCGVLRPWTDRRQAAPRRRVRLGTDWSVDGRRLRDRRADRVAGGAAPSARRGQPRPDVLRPSTPGADWALTDRRDHGHGRARVRRADLPQRGLERHRPAAHAQGCPRACELLRLGGVADRDARGIRDLGSGGRPHRDPAHARGCRHPAGRAERVDHAAARHTRRTAHAGWLGRRLNPRHLKRALVIYLLIAVALFSSTWIDPAGSLIGTPKDPKLFVWYLGWLPHELSLGHNPLFTDYLSFPNGVNLMWNTSMIFPAFLLWPVTAVFGPVVAYNVLVTAGLALSAWFGFLA